MNKILFAIAIAAMTTAVTTHAQAAPKSGGRKPSAANHAAGRPSAGKPAASHGVNKAAPAKAAPNHGVNKAVPPKAAPNHNVNKAAPSKVAPNHHAAPGKTPPNHGAKGTPAGKTGAAHHGNPGYGNANRVHNYHLQHGAKFQHGYFYRGRHHSHWTVIRFDPRYGCDLYFDPDLGVWYYWCAPDLCFYPVCYVPYRCYVCTEVVATRAIGETSRPTAPCPTCANGQAPVAYPSTPEPPLNAVALPIPEPVFQQPLSQRPGS